MAFNLRYKVYLDWTVPKNMEWDNDSDADWTEVFPEIEEFKKSPFSKEMFSRYSWGKVTFINNPNLTGDAEETYNLIADADIDQEIRIKVVLLTDMVDPDTSTTIRGYFGTNDCDFDGNKKTVTVTPTVLDQYTDLVENMETDVSIFAKEETKKASWVLASDYSTVYPSGIGSTHNMPVEVSASDMDESNTPMSVFSLGQQNSILNPLNLNYTGTFVIKLNATATISSGNTIKAYLNTYNSSGTLQDENLLNTYSEMTNGTIAETLNLVTSLSQGEYVMLRVVHSNTGDIIDYANISATLSATAVPFPTTDVSVNIQDSYLRTYEIIKESEHAFTDRFDTDNFDSQMSSLLGYFNANGSPKEMTTGENPNIYTPFAGNSNTISSNIIKELGVSVITIRDQYFGDIETDLDSYGFELSELTLFLCHSHKFWNDKPYYRTRGIAMYSRFEQYVTDGDSPSGSGWTDTEYINSDNKRLFTKKPFDGTITDWTIGSLIEESGSIEGTGTEYFQKLTSSKLPNYPDSDTSVVVPTRDFKGVVKTIYNGTFGSLVNADVESVFFWNDASSEITVASGINYVTDNTNWLNNIACLHTYQLRDAETESKDALLDISFKNLMADLKSFFNNQIFWWVDSDLTLHIEHLKYIDLTKQPFDLTDTSSFVYLKNFELLTEMSSWKYEKSEMYSLIDFEILNSNYVDFTGNTVTFDKIVSNKRNQDIKNTLSTRIISTDIRYGIENPSDLENGMILLNHDDSYVVLNATVPISGQLFENGNLALSNVLLRYKYEGVFLSGKINGGNVEFDITTRTKVGKEIVLRGIYDYDYFKSKLGVGFIESITHDLDNENTKITLRYRFGSGAQSDQFILMISEVGDFTGATDVQFNFG